MIGLGPQCKDKGPQKREEGDLISETEKVKYDSGGQRLEETGAMWPRNAGSLGDTETCLGTQKEHQVPIPNTHTVPQRKTTLDSYTVRKHSMNQPSRIGANRTSTQSYLSRGQMETNDTMTQQIQYRRKNYTPERNTASRSQTKTPNYEET